MATPTPSSGPPAPAAIRVRGARQNNLRSLDVDIPHDRLTVLTGVSGSGKSSLAFDVVFREAQRRYLEAFSASARQALGKLQRPEVDHIDGLRPAVAVSQRTTVAGPRSTVGTLTELSDLLRLTMARLGEAPRDFPLRLERSLFSFNTPQGACPACRGLGVEDRIDPDRLVADPARTLRQGALSLTTPAGYIIYSQVTMDVLDVVCRAHGFDVDTPWRDLSEDARRVVLDGSDRVRIPYGKHPLESRLRWKGITARPRQESVYKGILPVMEAILREKRNAGILRYARTLPCRACGGTRLRPEARLPLFRGRSIADWSRMSVGELARTFDGLTFGPAEAAAGEALRAAVRERSDILLRLGLGHLPLDRPSASLSGGEAQRIRLAGQAASGLRGVLYVLDEPTAGLHPVETARLIEVLRGLRDAGNTVLVVEHDEDVVQAADHVIEMGPGPGPAGGTVVRAGSPAGAAARPSAVSLTAPRAGTGSLVLRRARLRNLRSVDAEFRLGALNAVLGPAGSGKSALVREILAARLRDGRTGPGPDAEGLEAPDGRFPLIEIDQSPIGRTPRSNPATYTGISDRIRDLFAASPEAAARGFGRSRFSFNTPGGRCERCLGAGWETVGMHFLGDVEVPCPACETRRFNPETLEVRVDGKDIHQVLDLTVDEAAAFFAARPRLAVDLGWLARLGLGYLKLGQRSSTLSGGEAQRVRLASELMRPPAGRAVYLLEEPTTGLHRRDTDALLAALDDLLARGHTVVAIENDPWFLKSADRLIELGPGSGPDGGAIVFAGSPEAAAACPDSPIGRALARLREPGAAAPSVRSPAGPSAPSPTAGGPIALRGATTHNLKSIDVDIPFERLTVIAGPSGAGKSSLAFDTLHAESRRLFLETLPAYARERLDPGRKSGLEGSRGLTPPLAVGPTTATRHPRSTVGTMTELYDYLRLLYSRAGRAADGREPSGLAAGRFSFNTEDGACPRCRGLGRLTLADPAALITDPGRPLMGGAMDGSKTGRFYGEPHGRHAAALRAAAAAAGLDVDLPYRDLDPGARRLAFEGTGEALHDVVWSFQRGRRSGEHRFRGTWPGLAALIEEEYARKHGDARGDALRPFLREADCPDCGGARLKPEARAVTFRDLSIGGLCALSADEAEARLRPDAGPRPSDPRAAAAAAELLPEIVRRLGLLRGVGLGHLSLDRRSESLSGGEHQRLRLASLWGARLCGVTFVLDEPTRGLHPRDTDRLIGSLRGLTGEGNTVVVVEHDPDVLTAADHILELGPGPGRDGGRLVAAGPPAALAGDPASAAGRAIRALHRAPAPLFAAPGPGLFVRGARANNLKDIDVEIPSRALTAISGVSGSGKTSLVRDVILKTHRAGRPVDCEAVEGLARYASIVAVDQSPPPAGPLTTVAGHLDVLDAIRRRFADSEEARRLGLSRSHFSHLAAAGRCPACEGSGTIRPGLDFLAEVESVCPACGGSRFRPESLRVRLDGRTIADVLALPLDEAAAAFPRDAALARAVGAAAEAGLGYLELGRTLATLADGEIQRLRLAGAIASPPEGEALYLLDEPSAGLPADEVGRLAAVFDRMVRDGHTLVMVEHDPDLIARAYQVIDLGPEGGSGGGRITAAGSPAEVADRRDSATGAVLRRRYGDGLRTRPAGSA